MELEDIVRSAMERTLALTPLRFDCGRLCGKACCQGNEAGRGMLVYPGEDARRFPSGWRRERIVLPGYGPVPLVCCDGSCDRAERPLACRVFPLAPRLRDYGSFGVRLNAGGRPVCPLCHNPVSALDPAFVRAAGEIFHSIASDPEGRRFLAALSRWTDRFEDPLGPE